MRHGATQSAGGEVRRVRAANQAMSIQSGLGETQKHPPRTRQARVQTTYKNKKLKAVLEAEYGQKSLRELAAAISKKHGVTLTHGTLHRALNGIRPKRPELRKALRIPRPPRTGPTPRQKRWLAILGMLWGGDGSFGEWGKD